MTQTLRPLAACIALTTLSAAPALAADSLTEALENSETKLHLRTRFEDVDQDGVESSSALTQKTRLTFQSGTFNNMSFLLEMDDTTALTDVDYNDGTGINTDTAVIADPEGTEVNQVYVNYQMGGTKARYGRQRILLDNQRFVGGVGWRQNEQTFDALSLTNKSLENIDLFYAYVHNVNRIFGEGSPAGDHNHETHLLNASFSGLGAGKLVGYGYLIENKTAQVFSSDTFGLRWEGKLSESLGYNLEYASQTDAGDNPMDYSADYMLAEGVAGVQKFKFKLGYEVLGSDDGNAAFTTSLATLHAFQGWTDKFLGTPATGVEDLYVSAGHPVGPVNLTVVYHSLSANEGDMDYGNELGLVAGTKVGPVGLTFKYADYSADDYATDTRKLWLMAAMTF
ncbi:alginate export family protein [Marinimicrobium locisalis]|uniref:alginate export family protein n=1 Tax=Marinimicrobium locisalis TaxID=546022 RepID=UPI003222030E